MLHGNTWGKIRVFYCNFFGHIYSNTKEKIKKRMNVEDISRLKLLKNEVVKRNEKNLISRV